MPKANSSAERFQRGDQQIYLPVVRNGSRSPDVEPVLIASASHQYLAPTLRVSEPDLGAPSLGPELHRVSHARPRQERLPVPHLVAVVSAFAAIAASSIGIMTLIRQQGARLTGDEPHYLVAAESLGRFHTIHVGNAYQFAVSTRKFFPWSNPPVEQTFSSHGAAFAFHNLGLPALLALPTWIADQHGAEAGLLTVVAALTVWLAYLVGTMSQVKSPWRVCIAGLFLSPAYLLASTQVYPDLISGLLIAILIMLVARIEASRKCSWSQMACCGLLLGYLPWMHTQNALFAAVIASALIVVYRRTELRAWALIVGLGTAGLLWLLLALYNLYVFGRLGGPPGESFSWGTTAWTRVLALLIGRQQGMFIQFPVVLLGLAALWTFRRRIPVSAITTGVVVLAVIVTSGAFDNSFGGTSFVGRFQWSACPVLVAFAGLYLLSLFRRRRVVATVVAVGITAMYVGQLVPILMNDHEYYSYVGVGPQPPGNGWWGALDQFIPSFNELTQSWISARAFWGVLFLATLCGLILLGLVGLLSNARRFGLVVAATLVVAGALTGGLTGASAAQVMVPQTFSAKGLPSLVGRVVGDSRTVSGEQAHGALIFGPGWALPAGSYRATIHYRLADTDPRAAPVDAILAATPTFPRQVTLTKTFLSSRGRTLSLSFSIPKNRQLFVRVFWHGSGTLTVMALEIVQTSN
jgi:hypothetical protein